MQLTTDYILLILLISDYYYNVVYLRIYKEKGMDEKKHISNMTVFVCRCTSRQLLGDL